MILSCPLVLFLGVDAVFFQPTQLQINQKFQRFQYRSWLLAFAAFLLHLNVSF